MAIKKPILTLMYTFTIIKNHTNDIIFPGKQVIKNNKDSYFYSPTDKINNNMKIVYLYSSSNKDNEADLISWNNNEEGDLNLVGSFYAFPRETDNYNTYCLSVHISRDDNKLSLNVEWGKTNNADMSFWIFKEPAYVKLYPLSAIVWPPAQQFSDDITEIVNKYYKVVKVFDVDIKHPRFLKFVKNIYKGDRRCDKSQLPRKCRNMDSYPLRMRYIKFRVEDPDLDQMRVSQTAVRIKDVIRRKFRKKIPNYTHDICFHISDNASHSRSMDNYVKLELRDTNGK